MLSLSAISAKDVQTAKDPIGFFAFEGTGLAGVTYLSNAQKKAVMDAAADEGFSGKSGEAACFRLTSDGVSRRYIVVGLGKRKGFDVESLRKAAGAMCHRASRFENISVVAFDDPAVVGEGLLLASHSFDLYVKKSKDRKLKNVGLISQKGSDRARLAKAIEKASIYAEAVAWTRDLVNTGPSDKSPEAILSQVKEMAKQGITLKVIDAKEAKKLGMGSFLGVARGSDDPPYMLHLKYKPKKGGKKKIALVGKGVTFDSGGLSLKPPVHMETMKMDMHGAASVLGVFKVLTKLKVRAEVHGITPLTYNMPGPNAMKPGDVLKAMNGKTIEVLNTDAEGRLILADALAYAAKQKFDLMIDLATLTGAAVVALGGGLTAAMTNNKAALGKLMAVSKKTGEAIWELPLPKEYRKMIKSKVADIQNIGNARGEAGTITAGLFLEEFVDENPWIHLDIAGPAWINGSNPYCGPGATGVMVRTLLEYLQTL